MAVEIRNQPPLQKKRGPTFSRFIHFMLSISRGRDDPASSAFQLSSRLACAKCRIGVRSWYHLLIRVVGKDEKRKPITVKGLLDNGSELTIL